jgi:KaiC/GvpD/RAD55 family RecA-like ATPase
MPLRLLVPRTHLSAPACNRAAGRGTLRLLAPTRHMTAPPSEGKPLWYILYDDIKTLLKRKILLGAIGGIAIVGYGAHVLWPYRPSAVPDRVLAAFVEGGLPGWDQEFSADARANSKTSTVIADLERFIFPQDGDTKYVVIVGEHGTGKSTAVRSVVRNRTGDKGAVYVNTPLDVYKFSRVLATAVDFTWDVIDLPGGVRRMLSLTAKEETTPKRADEPLGSFTAVAGAIAAAAVKFKQQHGRPAVLIIDSAEIIAKDNPAFFAKMQDFAKQMTDAGNLRLVFVFSDGTAPEQMQSRSAWSRAHKQVYEVGDIPDADAVKYLVEGRVPQTQAEEAVRTITGGRFELLTDYVNVYAAAGNATTRDNLYRQVQKGLDEVNVDSRHAIFRDLLENKRIDDHAARLLWGGESTVIRALLAKNIIAAHPDNTFSFHSRYVETFFQSVFSSTGR